MDKAALFSLADSCRASGRTKTPEKRWLRNHFERLYAKYGLVHKEDGDRLIYTRVFGGPQQTPSDLLKVRYWRTGRTLPANRAILLALGSALELEEGEIGTLVRRYYDRNDRLFSPSDDRDPVYQARRAYMMELKQEFTDKLHPMYLQALHIRRQDAQRYFRHLYYLESLLYTESGLILPAGGPASPAASHLVSVSYGSTLRALMQLQGEIPRRNMLRHLLILMAPFVNRERMDLALEKLGFLPLTPDHHGPGGERLDALIIGLLEAYETECGGLEPERCLRWLRQTLRELDSYLATAGAEDLRFMRYKSIRKTEGGEMHIRSAQAEPGYMEDRLYWSEQMCTLRKKYAGTPAGFRDDASVRAAKEEIQALKQTWEEQTVSRLIAPAPTEPAHYIVPRDALLKRISRSFSAGSHLVILYGMGGIGKSTLAGTYAYRHRAEYDAVLLLNCENGFEQAIFDDGSLQISNLRYTNAPHNTMRGHIRKKLTALGGIASERRLLLELDNCDFMSDSLMGRVFALPADILVTTRVRPEAWADALPALWSGIEVPADGFEQDEEWEEFARALRPGEDWRSARDELCGNILATRLHLMGAGVSGQTYYFREADLSRREKQLLCFVSLLPLEGIAAELLARLAPGTEQARETLVRRGLLERTSDDRLQIHPLIREEARRQLGPSPALLRGIIRRLADLVFNAWEDSYENNLAMEPYVQAVLHAFPNPPPTMARDFDCFITLLWILCRGDDALRCSLRLYRACERRYGPIHETTGFCALRTGAVFRNIGRIREAEDWFRRAYEILEKAPASTCCMIAYRIEANTRMSLIAGEHGDKAGVCRHNLRALELSKTLMEKYPDRLPGYRGDPALKYPYALLRQSEFLLSCGDTAGAEEYRKQASAALKKTNTALYRELEFDRMRIRILLRQNLPETARPLAERCAVLARAYRGPASREYLRAQDLLADVLAACGNPEEASGIYEGVMETLTLRYPGERSWSAAILEKWSGVSVTDADC